ncbi:sensor histidine kinase [Pseudonocardiaceae bacterium YIM PH 21723]|nr:sensor histidine kinase [Pseudonocardiaceae bacterium YIM PH 21723]
MTGPQLDNWVRRLVPAPIRGRLARVPLRMLLVALLVVLLSAAMLGTGIAATSLMRDYLVTKVDDQAAQIRPFLANKSPNAPGPGGRRGPGFGGDYLLLRRTSTDIIREAENTATKGQPKLPRYSDEFSDRPFTAPSTVDGQSWRVQMFRARWAPDDQAILAIPLSGVDSDVSRLQQVLLIIGLLAVLIFAGLGYVLVRMGFRRLEQVEETADLIAAGDLSRRVAPGHPKTEVGRLAGALNTMLGQIENAFRARETAAAEAQQSEQRMRRFIADASHELRTPLTSIRGYAELYRQGAVPPGPELDRVVRRIEDEAARMGLMVEDLLLLARLDHERPLRQEVVDLVVLGVDAVTDARTIDPERPISLRLDLAENEDGRSLPVLADEVRLRQVIVNLMSNAQKHTPAGSPVTLRLSERPGWAVFEVIDEGPGLAPEDAQRVFDRFYRAELSRNREHGGAGLGLSIVAALVGAHGGRVELDTGVGKGATFRVLLPALDKV